MTSADVGSMRMAEPLESPRIQSSSVPLVVGVQLAVASGPGWSGVTPRGSSQENRPRNCSVASHSRREVPRS